MTAADERTLFEAYSRGEITRRELERRAGYDVPFGDALLKLYEYQLPLPRYPVDLDTPGVHLLRSVLRRKQHG